MDRQQGEQHGCNSKSRSSRVVRHHSSSPHVSVTHIPLGLPANCIKKGIPPHDLAAIQCYLDQIFPLFFNLDHRFTQSKYGILLHKIIFQPIYYLRIDKIENSVTLIY